MATLTLVGEPLPGENPVLVHAMQAELALALAAAAPKGCDVAMLLGRGTHPPDITHPKLRFTHYPVRAARLPLLWSNSATARGVEGDIQHAATPLAALHSQAESNGQQTSITIPHALAWTAPHALPAGVARQIRGFTRRAVRHADIILVPSHDIASTLRQAYGDQVQVQVVPAAPLADSVSRTEIGDAAARLSLPEQYLLTAAEPNDFGRLRWTLEALDSGAAQELPLVFLTMGAYDPAAQLGVFETGEHTPVPAPSDSSGATATAVRSPLRTRRVRGGNTTPSLAPLLAEFPRAAQQVMHVHASTPAEVVAVTTGASTLIRTETQIGSGLLTLTALANHVPVLHPGDPGTAELVLDGGRAFASATDLASLLRELSPGSEGHEHLALSAGDRGRQFSWQSTAWQIWQMHADL